MSSLSISSKRIWNNHESRVLKIITRALEMMREESNLDINEDRLNRKLYFYLLRANRVLHSKNEGLDMPPYYEAHNQPDSDDEERALRENKRPDFQWGFIDHSIPDPDRSAKHYTIECKRLGKPLRKDRVFNENYIKNGVIRFIYQDIGYGRSSPSGAMVGYVRSMALGDILFEVNVCATEESLPEIILSQDGWIEEGVSRLNQILERPEVPPSPFSLKHLWVDFRQH